MRKIKWENYIGKKFPTQKGSVLTVTSFLGKDTYGLGLYEVNCSVCSQDKELFPSITSSKNSLEKGSVPCGCATNPKWTEYQTKVRLSRVCNSKNYRIEKYIGTWTGNTTEVELSCGKGHESWVSPVKRVLRGDGCKLCGYDNQSNHREEIGDLASRINNTELGNKNLVFKRSERIDKNGYKTYIDVTCDTCAKDKYSSAGVGSGTFTSKVSHLLAGHIPCRCSKNTRYTKEQHELNIKEDLKVLEGTWEGWADYKTKYFSWVCKEGHGCTTSVQSFKQGKYKCKKCAMSKGSFGLHKDKLGYEDTLYLLLLRNQADKVLKVGRSFCIDRRVKDYLKLFEVDVVALLNAPHEVVYNKEQSILREYSKYSITPSTLFDGRTECLDVSLLEDDSFMQIFS